jgi:hypothetical protein
VALDPFELSADGCAPGADECAGETHQKQADSFLAGVVDKEGDHLIGSAHRRRGGRNPPITQKPRKNTTIRSGPVQTSSR